MFAAESGWQVVKLCERNHYPRMVWGGGGVRTRPELFKLTL